jgi:tetratricopeptide (TPR) repeat protein
MVLIRRRFSWLLLLLFVVSCRGPVVPKPSNRTAVILISIDTLRSDHLPVYGYRKVETPAIDRLRADGILFQHAYSHVPLTLPSHTTMFTGRLPADNGVRDNIGFHLDPKIPTLAEILKRNGYATGAAVSAFVLRRETGISRGFDFYEDQIDPANSGANVGRVQRKGGETEQIAEKWIGEHRGQPFFFFLHLYEPHTPYEPPEPFRSRYPLPYDGEIATADDIVGHFIGFLQQQGIYDQALIILLSDHGEGLNDHGEQEHGIFLYREALQVPLLLKLPGRAMHGASVETPVQLSDVFPTIAWATASKTGLTVAQSLIDVATHKPASRQVYSETLFPKFHYGWSDLHSLITESRHYIEAPRAELYDVRADPAEKNNILLSDRRSYVALRAAIAPLIRTSLAPAPVSAEEASKLAALGYIGSAVPTAGDLPDPKDKVATSGELRRAFILYDKGQYAEALPLLQKLVQENERLLDVWDIMARTLDQLGRTDEAIAAAKRGLQLSPNTAHLALMVAKMCIDKGRLDEAQKHAELALEGDPAVAHDILARVWLARGDFPRAEKEAHLALEDRDRVFALLTIAKIEMQRKNYPGALAWSDRAVGVLERRHGTGVKGVYFLRGDALARLDRVDEAEGAFLKEVEMFPRDPDAYKNLILLYVTEGRNDQATRMVFDLIKRSPTPPAYIAVVTTLRTIGDVNGARYWTIKALQQFPDDPGLRKLARG